LKYGLTDKYYYIGPINLTDKNGIAAFCMSKEGGGPT
jgi:hypothetical protein